MSDEYKEKAERIKKSYEKRQAAATEEKGLIIVHTGSGKGKSTAAFGMLLSVCVEKLEVGVGGKPKEGHVGRAFRERAK